MAKQWPKDTQNFLSKNWPKAKKRDVETVNETVTQMNAQPLVDTGIHISADVGEYSWQQ